MKSFFMSTIALLFSVVVASANQGSTSVDSLVNTEFAQQNGVVLEVTIADRILRPWLLQHSPFEVLSYTGNNSYMCFVQPRDFPRLNDLKSSVELRSIRSETKVGIPVQEQTRPDYAARGGEQFLFAVRYYKPFSLDEVVSALPDFKDMYIERSSDKTKTLFVVCTHKQIELLAEHEAISAVDYGPSPYEHGNRPSRGSAGVPALFHLDGLDGEGILVGVWDGGVGANHYDYKDRRSIEDMSTDVSSHATHVTGTVAGNGLLNERAKGMAPAVNVLSYEWTYDDIEREEAVEYTDMSLSNQSYSYSYDDVACGSKGAYLDVSILDDELANDYTYYLQVWSAGNYASECSDGWNTVRRGHQVSKNNLTVANVADDYYLSASSSRGPSADGRTKPEIAAIGSYVYSTYLSDSYQYMSGTSMASPVVTGTLALLSQWYVDEHDDFPRSDLLKAVVCNTALDINNELVDYRTGYGTIQSHLALQTLQNGNYDTSENVDDGDTTSFDISVTDTSVPLRVMLAWIDVPGTAYDTNCLVQDLDLILKSPSGVVYRPWILDPSNPDNIAVRGVDTRNNMEQVTVAPSETGTWEVLVIGTDVPMGAQDFVVTWFFDTQRMELLSLQGGEETSNTWEYLYFDNGSSTDSTHLDFSFDGGTTWVPNDYSLPAEEKYFAFIPSQNWPKYRVRVRNSADTSSSTTDVIFRHDIDAPTVQQASSTSAVISWNSPEAIEGSVTISISTAGEWISSTTQETTSTVVSGFEPDVEALIKVGFAGISGKEYRTAIAYHVPYIEYELSGRTQLLDSTHVGGIYLEFEKSDDANVVYSTTSSVTNGSYSLTVEAPATYVLTVVSSNFTGTLNQGEVVEVTSNTAFDVTLTAGQNDRVNLNSYSAYQEPAAYTELSAVGSLLNADDGYTTLQLPFSFPFRNAQFDTVHVCSNGFLKFGTPSNSLQNNLAYGLSDVVAPLWDDLVCYSNSSQVSYHTWPDSVIIQFKDAYRYSYSSSKLNFQVTLHSNGRIVFSYGELLNVSYINASIGLSGYYNDGAGDFIAKSGYNSFADQIEYYQIDTTGLPNSRIVYNRLGGNAATLALNDPVAGGQVLRGNNPFSWSVVSGLPAKCEFEVRSTTTSSVTLSSRQLLMPEVEVIEDLNAAGWASVGSAVWRVRPYVLDSGWQDWTDWRQVHIADPIKQITVKAPMRGMTEQGNHKQVAATIELRRGDTLSTSQLVTRQAGVYAPNGELSVDMKSLNTVLADSAENLWVVVRKPGHLPVAFASQVSIAANGEPVYLDFSESQSAVHNGSEVMVQEGNLWVVRGGDLNGDNNVTSGDLNAVLRQSFGKYNPGEVPEE